MKFQFGSTFLWAVLANFVKSNVQWRTKVCQDRKLFLRNEFEWRRIYHEELTFCIMAEWCRETFSVPTQFGKSTIARVLRLLLNVSLSRFGRATSTEQFCYFYAQKSAFPGVWSGCTSLNDGRCNDSCKSKTSWRADQELSPDSGGNIYHVPP